ncbi:MAG: signal peptidase I [Gammaproteobacteria bacterium]|nr:signal peptidase I [Gammaproteobacteria bacterium]
MHFDFEVLLVGFVFISGIVWLVDHLLWAEQRLERKGEDPIAVEYAKSFFPVLLVVMILRSFIIEPFRIPSGSMMPTLLIGDFILVNKYTYGIRLPVTHNKVTEGTAPKRGDVAVFRYPGDESFDYIKRVVGVPGDRISYYDKELTVNGKKVDIEFDRDYEGQGTGSKNMAGNKVFNATIGEVTHTYMIDPTRDSMRNGTTVVPDGQFFVMGDNRDHSNDSRYWGFVPEKNLVGKAFMVWMHWDWSDSGSGLDISRVGTSF